MKVKQLQTSPTQSLQGRNHAGFGQHRRVAHLDLDISVQVCTLLGWSGGQAIEVLGMLKSGA